MPEDKIEYQITRSEVVAMQPYYCLIRFDNPPETRVEIAYGEYHDGEFYRGLQAQFAPPEDGLPVSDGVYAAMEAKAKATLEAALAKEPEDRDENEQYLAALHAASVQ